VKVLVTGGFGYIGGRLSDALRGWEGYQVVVHGRRVPPFLEGWVKGLEARLADITQPDALRDICEGVDAVVHLASMDENECVADPMGALEVNVRGTYQVLQEALRAGVKQFVYFSTFHVYGPGAGLVYHEGLLPQPLHHYGITRLMAEQYVRQAGAGTGMQTVIVRLSNGFGAPLYPDVDRWTLVFNDLCLRAIRDRKLVLRSSGLQHRDFIPMGDIVEAVRLLLEAGEGSLVYDVYQVGSGRSVSIRDAAEIVRGVYQRAYGERLPLEVPDPGPDEVHKPVQFDIGRMKALGFRPCADWEEEVHRTLTLCQAHLQEIPA